MKRLIIKYTFEITGAATGAAAGWIYWYFVGCASGSCAITSSPVNSTIYGALMGTLIPGLFQRNKKQNAEHENRTEEQNS